MKVLFLEPQTINSYDRRKSQDIVHDIQDRLRSIRFKEAFDFSSRWAVTAGELIQILNEEEPDILHICTKMIDGKLSMSFDYDAMGRPSHAPVSIELLGQILDTLPKKVQLLYLDVCFSGEMARYVDQNVGNVARVIGIEQSISNLTARRFASQFYSSLGFGLSLPQAVQQAGLQVLLASPSGGEQMPFLLPKDAGELDFEKGPKTEKTMSVLFLEANPLTSYPLALDQEAKEIQNRMNSTTQGAKMKFESRWCVDQTEVLDLVNEVHPKVLHFSGHGTDDGHLVFETKTGGKTYLAKEYAGEICRVTSQNIKVALFNACFSKGAAEEAAKYIDCAIGMKWEVMDDAAICFAAQFYSSLGYGLDVKTAFEQARVSLMLGGHTSTVKMMEPDEIAELEEEAKMSGETVVIPEINQVDIPQLFVKEGVDPSKIYLV